ncbi:MAG: hypothetical protein ACRC62_39320 [Microcoleus sp.]
MNPNYPVYVISKGRWESRLTVKALEKCKVPYSVVIEPQEYDQYAKVVDPKKIKVLPFSNLGQGSIPARNWVWENSIALGFKRHWILDDNIRAFYRLHQNKKYYMNSGDGFHAIETLADRYTNIALCGMQYGMFVPAKQKIKPLTLNTRVYSCILIQNNIPYRWRGRYNEDTDLSLRALKDGFCTFLCNAFLAEKIATMRLHGGNTDELYKQNDKFDGRLEMARSLQRQHPDVTQVVWKWNRWQHEVDYSRFKANRPILRDGVVITDEPINYGMKLVRKQ